MGALPFTFHRHAIAAPRRQVTRAASSPARAGIDTDIKGKSRSRLGSLNDTMQHTAPPPAPHANHQNETTARANASRLRTRTHDYIQHDV